MIGKIWYASMNGQQKGPFYLGELKGKISKNTLVWKEGMTDWAPCGELDDFKEFFTHLPPPLPNTDHTPPDPPQEVNSAAPTEVQLMKMKTAFQNCIILLVLSFVAGITALAGGEQTRFYGLLLFVTGLTFARVLQGLKYFLNHFKSYHDANANIRWVIALTVIAYTALSFSVKVDWDELSYSDTFAIIVIIVFVGIVLAAIHTVSLLLKLLKINGPEMKYFRAFALSHILISGIFIGMSFYQDETYTPTFFDTVLDLIPIALLATGFYQLRNSVDTPTPDSGNAL